MSGARARMVLDVDLEFEPIKGTLSTDGGPPRAFSGWLALAREIDLARAAARLGPPAPPPLTPGRDTRIADGSHPSDRI